MQPNANIKPRAALHQSAPSANKRAISKPVTTRPLAPRRMDCRSPAPTRQLWASTKPSRSGVPTWSTNSSGAAPVPPSDPSITMKSGRIPVSSMALQSAMNSQAWPMQSLKPTGLPPDKSRNWAMHHLDRGLERRMARWRDAIDADRHTACVRNLRGHLGAGQHAAVAGLGPLRQLDLDHLDLRFLRLRGEPVGAE